MLNMNMILLIGIAFSIIAEYVMVNLKILSLSLYKPANYGFNLFFINFSTAIKGHSFSKQEFN